MLNSKFNMHLHAPNDTGSLQLAFPEVDSQNELKLVNSATFEFHHKIFRSMTFKETQLDPPLNFASPYAVPSAPKMTKIACC